MGIWVRSPQLAGGERVVWKKYANRTQGGRAVGGRLYMTDSRLFFQPSRIDAATKGQFWSAPLAAIEGVSTDAPDGNYFSGGLRTRLQINVSNGATELFVVNHVGDAVQAIQQGIGSKA
jgi:hypothetical protein